MFAVSTFTRLTGSLVRHCGSFFKSCQSVPSMQLSSLAVTPAKPSLLGAQSTTIQPVRNRIAFNHAGNPETVKDVVDRFFRLRNGLWIRPRVARHKRRWTKIPRRNHRLSQHVFCTKRQAWMLDKMVNKEYRVTHHYVQDPYEPYHRLSNLPDRRYQPPKFLP